MSAVARLLTVLAALALAAPAGAVAAPPPIKHVFVVVLENKDATKTFAADSPAPYLANTLPARGLFVPNYYGIGHVSLDNYVAMLSGQAPNPQTQSDCQVYTEFLPGTMGADGQATGSGCVYPKTVKTLPDQLAAKGLSWKGYMEDIGSDPARDSGTTCAHPPLNQRDATQTAAAKDQYATRHNPFVYFHSIIDDAASCNANVVPLDRLDNDLRSEATTPTFSFITPDLCSDGHDETCADGGPGGLKAVNGFLERLVPKITGAPAWKDSLLIVTFDEAESDSAACCNEPTGPNTASPGGAEAGPGGGRVGAVLLSPYITPGTTTKTAYNHYAFLRSVEDLNGLEHLGYAAQTGLAPFGEDVYTNPAGTPSASGVSGSPGATAAPSPTSRAKAAPRCHSTTLRGTPHHARRGALISGLHLSRTARRRTVRIRGTHDARVIVRTTGHVRRLRVRACHTYRVAVGRRGHVRIAATTAHYSEHRTL